MNPSNKEWIKNVKLADIIDFLRNLCALMKIDHKEVVFENLGDIKKVEYMIEEEEDKEFVEEEAHKEKNIEEEADVIEEEEQEENEQEEIQQEDIDQQVQSRVCNKCSKKKDIDMFKRHGRGYSLSCLECVKPYQRPRGNCVECNSMLFNKQSKRCVACAKKNTRIVDRPAYEQLKRDLESMSYVACGRKYGVSDNSIRKWIRFYQGKPTKPVFKV